jgi:hypothetical protein
VTLLAGPFPAWTVFIFVPIGGLLWGVIFALLAVPFRFFRRTRRPWISVGIPAVAYLGFLTYAAREELPRGDPLTPAYFVAIEGLLRALMVFAIGIFLAVWFYKRRDTRRERHRA